MSSNKIITPGQCRGARAVLEWSQEQLATEAGVNRMTIADFERGTRSPLRNNLVMIRQAFEQRGITFIDENGGPPGIREPRSAVRLMSEDKAPSAAASDESTEKKPASTATRRRSR